MIKPFEVVGDCKEGGKGRKGDEKCVLVWPKAMG